MGYSSWGRKESVMTEHACTHIHIILYFIHINIYIYTFYSVYFGNECQSPPLCFRDLCPLRFHYYQICVGTMQAFSYTFIYTCVHSACRELYLVFFHFFHFSNVSA